MKIMKLKLSEIKRPENNVRIHTERQLHEFERSVKMFGQIRPIVVDENNTIMCGEGLYLTLCKMGVETADAYVVIGLTDNQKKKLMIADNKIYGLGIENLDTLNTFLEELGNDLDVPGFDEEILKTMVAEAEEVTAKICEYGSLDKEEIENIRENGKENISPAEQSPPDGEHRESEGGETADTRKFVVCPECGAKFPTEGRGAV
jgi:ParB-like chromosome segregation protein Spo0J